MMDLKRRHREHECARQERGNADRALVANAVVFEMLWAYRSGDTQHAIGLALLAQHVIGTSPRCLRQLVCSGPVLAGTT